MTRRPRPLRRGVLAGPAALLCLLCTAAPAGPDAGIVTIDVGTVPADFDVTLRRMLRNQSYLLLQQADGSTQVWLLSRVPAELHAALGAMGDDGPALHRILQDLADPDPAVREEAILSLGDARDGTAVDLVSQSLYDDSPLVREAAAAVLEEFGATDYLPPDRPTD